MATVVNNPSSDTSSGASTLFLGLILLLVVFLFFYFGLPLLRNAGSGTQINVPDQIDVNVNRGQTNPGQ